MPTEETAVPEPELKRRFLNWRTLLSFLIAAGLLALTIWLAEIDPRQVWEYMRGANFLLYALGFLAFYATFPLRSWRWGLLLKNASADDPEAPPVPRLFDLLEIIYLSWFANCIVPAKLGDLYRGYLLKRTSGASFSHTVGTIFAERVLDMLFLFLVMVAASLATFGSQIPAGSTATIVYGGGIALAIAAVAILLAMRFFGPALRRWVPARFRGIYDRFLEGTLLSFRRRRLPLILGQTVLIWVLESVRFYCVFISLLPWLREQIPSLPGGSLLGIPVIVFIALASSLLTTLPITPAGLGPVEAMFVWILPLFLPSAITQAGLDPKQLAFAVGLLDRTINYWSIVVLGFIAFLISKKK